MTTMTAGHQLADEATLRAITDPRKRLRTASETAAAAKKLAGPHRVRRNAAAILMLHTGQVHAVDVWQDTIGLSRTRWNRVTTDADASRLRELRAQSEDLQDRIDRTPIDQAREITRLGKEKSTIDREAQRTDAFLRAIGALRIELGQDNRTPQDAVASAGDVARTEAEITDRYDAVAGVAQDVARETLLGLLDGTFGGICLSNAEVARIAGVTPGRIAQLRGAPTPRR